MSTSYLQLRFENDDDGTGKLLAKAVAGNIFGEGGAYFNTTEIESFAKQLTNFPLPIEPHPSLSGGFWKKNCGNQLEQEHLGITVYTIDLRGNIGIQIRIADECWPDNRLEAQRKVQLEIKTTYEPLARFGRHRQAIICGTMTEAVLEGE